MAQEGWRQFGSSFLLDWNRETWRLTLDGARPGLCTTGESSAFLLSLGGLAAPGRHDGTALSAASLVTIEPVRSRLEATFIPRGWNGLTVRAAWGPITPRGNGLDLEIQVTASSVDELRSLEVYVISTSTGPASPHSEEGEYLVTPRDSASAALSYDGREPSDLLARLTNLPIPDPQQPIRKPLSRVFQRPGLGGRFLEMVHPQDISRRVDWVSKADDSSAHVLGESRWCLFGYDLEKGVVLRGRLRGVWLPADDIGQGAATAFDEFLAQPLPLGS